MVHLAKVYRLLTDEERIIAGDEFTMRAILNPDCWGAVDKFIGMRVRNASDRGKILFRRLESNDIQLN